MKEIRHILTLYEAVDFSRQQAALATIVWVRGTSRRPGARVLILDNGRWEGSIGSGRLQGDDLHEVRRVMQDSEPIRLTYDLMQERDRRFGFGLGCSGIVEVLIEPVGPAVTQNPMSLFREFTRQRNAWVLATVWQSDASTNLSPGTRFALNETEALVPDYLRNEMQSVLHSGKSLTKTYAVESGHAEVFMERIDPGVDLIIFGAGYDVVPLVKLAGELGWPVTLTHDCTDGQLPQPIPVTATVRYADSTAALDALTLTIRTAAVLMSHNFNYDQTVLKSLLASQIPYIGLLGPRRRFERMRADYEQEGLFFSAASLSRVHAPIGLDLGAETPDELALAIVAEIRAFFAGRSGGYLKDRPGLIHEPLPANRPAQPQPAPTITNPTQSV